jgi:hypothetical protein
MDEMLELELAQQARIDVLERAFAVLLSRMNDQRLSQLLEAALLKTGEIHPTHPDPKTDARWKRAGAAAIRLADLIAGEIGYVRGLKKDKDDD